MYPSNFTIFIIKVFLGLNVWSFRCICKLLVKIHMIKQAYARDYFQIGKMHLYLLFTSGNCNDIRVQNQTALSSEYNITLDSGQVVHVYCEFMVKRGYAFIQKSTLSSLTTLEGLYDISDHAIIRTLYGNGEQHEVEVAQLSMFKHRFPLSIQLSS